MLVRCCALHPWLGGGFGMFSTVDERHLVAWQEGPGGDAPIALPEKLDDAAERAEALPREARLRAIAEELAADPESGAGAVRVEVWETHYRDGMTPVQRRLAAARADAQRR